MKVWIIMSRPVVWISSEATIDEAAQMMRRADIGDLPVCKDRKVVGIITDRDITIRACADGLDPRVTRVGEVMTEGVQWCFSDDDLERIIKRMESKKIHRMIVVDHNKKLVGVISLGDIAVKADEALAGEVLHHISSLRRIRPEGGERFGGA